MTNYVISLCIAFLGMCSAASYGSTDSNKPSVLASVHPLALVAASVVPKGNLSVLVPPTMTPHDFSLRPSDIDLIQAADIIIWAGVESEPYLKGFARRWPDKTWINVADLHSPGMPLDPHWWFSPDLMKQLQAALANHFDADSAEFARRVDQVMTDNDALLADVRNRGFFVFHRAYDHWVNALQLNQLGAFTLSPERRPGLRTLRQMRKQLERGDVVCVFSEPEFSQALVQRLTEGLEIGRGELDPMAANIALDEDGYVAMLSDMAARTLSCLSETLSAGVITEDMEQREGVLGTGTELDAMTPTSPDHGEIMEHTHTH